MIERRDNRADVPRGSCSTCHRASARFVIPDVLRLDGRRDGRVLDVSVAPPTSLLQRARRTLRKQRRRGRQRVETAERHRCRNDLLGRYMQAHERRGRERDHWVLGASARITMPPEQPYIRHGARPSSSSRSSALSAQATGDSSRRGPTASPPPRTTCAATATRHFARCRSTSCGSKTAGSSR